MNYREYFQLLASMISLRLSLFFTLIFSLISNQTSSTKDRKANIHAFFRYNTYIVYMGDHPKGMDSTSLPSLHMTMAQKVLGSDFEPKAILHSYKKSFNGFVIKLTQEDAVRMTKMDSVVSVFPNKKNHPHTTRSWDFIGVSQQILRTSLESDIIVE
ncbi:hypothetical protein VNO80_05815 [Phaseolus coccineus]|uniref:Inhibitor I9 domain-containing protein n=1 Tax=Phaseolus coccineus TaxID=3886 RepID=A0AAN9RIF3_PHACN